MYDREIISALLMITNTLILVEVSNCRFSISIYFNLIKTIAELNYLTKIESQIRNLLFSDYQEHQTNTCFQLNCNNHQSFQRVGLLRKSRVHQTRRWWTNKIREDGWGRRGIKRLFKRSYDPLRDCFWTHQSNNGRGRMFVFITKTHLKQKQIYCWSF